jgi:hypothetical protein
MRRPKALSSISVEEFVEKDEITPIGIAIQHIDACVASTSSVIVAGEDVLQTVLEFFGDVTKMHELSRTCWTLYLKVIAVEHEESKK